jgi:hypothetical protein
MTDVTATLPPRAADPGMSDEAMLRGSGKTWDEWFRLLDAWGAAGRTHTEIARYVAEAHGVPGWWAQGVTVGYERARGMRRKHETTGGFAAGASKTIAVPIERLYQALVDEAERDRWLEPGTLHLRTAREHRSARFDATEAQGGIIEVWLTARGPDRASIQLQQGKLADEAAVAAWRDRWKPRLQRLADTLTRS